MSEKTVIRPGNVGCETLAELCGVSRPTAFRWAREPGRLPTPVNRPGEPTQWERGTIQEFAENYRRIRECESAMEVFANAEQLHPVLRQAARLVAKRLQDTATPVVLRGKLAGIAEAVNWQPGKLTESQQTQARRLVLRLLDLVSGGAE